MELRFSMASDRIFLKLIIFLFFVLFISEGCIIGNNEDIEDKVARKPILIINTERGNIEEELDFQINIYHDETIIFTETMEFTENKYITEMNIDAGENYIMEINGYDGDNLAFNHETDSFKIKEYEIKTIYYTIEEHSNTVTASK